MENIDFFSNFFKVSNPLSTKNYRGEIINRSGGFADLLRSEQLSDRLEIKHYDGGKDPSELFWNVLQDPICVKNSIINILNSNNIKGWNKIPLIVSNKSGDRIYEDYYGLAIYGRVDPMDYLQSDIFLKEMPGGLFPYFKGIRFNPETWDVSDIFMERMHQDGRETAHIFVTKRFVELFRKQKNKNITFTSFNDYEVPCFDILIHATGQLKKRLEEKIKKCQRLTKCIIHKGGEGS
jgi:hypothetical protein